MSDLAELLFVVRQRDLSARVRSAITQLGSVGQGSAEAVAALRSLLTGTDIVVCADAVESLGRMGARDAIPDLADLVRPEAERERGLTGFVDPFGWYEPTPRIAAIEALGRLGASECADRVAERLQDEDVNCVEAAFLALTAFKDRRHAAAATRALRSFVASLRRAATEYLVALDPASGREAAASLAVDGDPEQCDTAHALFDALRFGSVFPCPACRRPVRVERRIFRGEARRDGGALALAEEFSCSGCLTVARTARPFAEPVVLATGAVLARVIERIDEGAGAWEELAALRATSETASALNVPEVFAAIADGLGPNARLRGRAVWHTSVQKGDLHRPGPRVRIDQPLAPILRDLYTDETLADATPLVIAGRFETNVLVKPDPLPAGHDWSRLDGFVIPLARLDPPRD